MTFRILPLSHLPFAPLAALSDDALAAIGARRVVADAPNSAPCRVSLADADPGDRLLLVHHVHLDAPASPYRAGGPIFVREGVEAADPEAGVVPDMLARRLLSARAYDAEAMMRDADVVEGVDLADRLEGWFADPDIETVHIHTARRGCYLARAVRAA